VDEPWDRNAAVSAMPNDDEVLHYCFAWESQEAADAPSKKGDNDADDKKGSYSFPHHKGKGSPANIPACRNGLARLEGSNIPEADKAGVKAHLQAHLDDFHKKSGDGDGKSDNTAGFQLVDEAAWAQAVRLGNLVSEERIREHAARAQLVSDRTEFFRFTNISADVAQLDIYDGIGWYGVSASDFSQQLRAVTASTLNVHINSPGGDVFDGIAIGNMLKAHPADVHVYVDSIAASAASFIAMAGKTVTMMPNSQLMIHDAAGVCAGNQKDMLEFAELLDRNSNNIASIYSARAGGTTEQWRAAMRAETWYSADEAVEAGLADRVGDTDSPSSVDVVTDRWNLSFYNYAGRAAAPAPAPIAAAPATPAAGVATPPVGPAVDAQAIATLVAEHVAALIPPAAPPVPVAVADPAPVADTAPAPTPVSAPAAAPAADPALAARRAEDEPPVWNADVFRLALERAAQ
jgi:ATP-dependent protease ClpP protease subunit